MVVKNSPLRHKPLNRDDDLVTNSSYPQGYPPSWWIEECKGNIFRFEAAIVLRDPAPPTRARLATRGPPSYADGFVRGLPVKSRSHVGREHTLAYPLDRAERVNRRRLDLIGEGQHVFGKPRIDDVIWGKPSIGAPRFRRAQQAADGFKNLAIAGNGGGVQRKRQVIPSLQNHPIVASAVTRWEHAHTYKCGSTSASLARTPLDKVGADRAGAWGHGTPHFFAGQGLAECLHHRFDAA